MNRHLWVIAICILAGCSNSNSDKAVLPQDKMAKVLWDMIQVDELATLRLVKDTSKNVKNERIMLYEKVFKLHQTSQQQFSNSFTFYTNHPDLMKSLFDTLEVRGQKERSMSYIKKDSIAK